MRSFTIVKINSNDRRVKSKSIGGRFQSINPASAAKKAGSSICRLNNINSSIKFKVAIRETTQGSAHKVFVYSFSRVRNPRTVMRSGKHITYEFETKVKSLMKKKSTRHDGEFDSIQGLIETLRDGDPADIFEDDSKPSSPSSVSSTTSTSSSTPPSTPLTPPVKGSGGKKPVPKVTGRTAFTISESDKKKLLKKYSQAEIDKMTKTQIDAELLVADGSRSVKNKKKSVKKKKKSVKKKINLQKEENKKI